MAKTVETYRIDKDALEHLMAVLKDAIKKGATDDEIQEQVYEILDVKYRIDADQSFGEMRKGNANGFRSINQMVNDLRSD